MLDKSEKLFVNKLINVLKREYDHEIKLDNKINETCKFIEDYFSELKNELKNIINISDGDIEVETRNSSNIIAKIDIFKNELSFQKSETGICVNLKRDDGTQERIDYINCESTEVNINEYKLNEILETAFEDVFDNLKNSQ